MRTPRLAPGRRGDRSLEVDQRLSEQRSPNKPYPPGIRPGPVRGRRSHRAAGQNAGLLPIADHTREITIQILEMVRCGRERHAS